MLDLSKKRNGRKINVLYPSSGNKNVLRSVSGIKLRSGTSKSGNKYITVQEDSGQIRSLSLDKVVRSLA